jgi:hypothetical protein
MTKLGNLFNMAKQTKTKTKKRSVLLKFEKKKDNSVLQRNIYKQMYKQEHIKKYKLKQEKELSEIEGKITDYSMFNQLIKTFKYEDALDETIEECEKSCKLENNNSKLARFIKATKRNNIEKYQKQLFHNVNNILNSQVFFYKNACEKRKKAHIRAYYRYIKKQLEMK